MTNYKIVSNDSAKVKLANIAIKSNNDKAIQHFINIGVIENTISVNTMKERTFKAFNEAYKNADDREKYSLNHYGFSMTFDNIICEMKPRRGMINSNHFAYTFFKDGKRVKASEL